MPHETFGHLVTHFVADFVHYDSKTYTTLRNLLFRPGFLTKAYMAGKRASYVNPIKLYIFIAFLFFLALAGLNKLDHKPHLSSTERLELDSLLADRDTVMLSGTAKDFASRLNTYHSREQYDSLQQALPAAQQDSWTQKKLAHVYFRGMENGWEDTSAYFTDLLAHNIPRLMFILLPLFAWYIKLMYDKKRWYYADHAIFSIHFHSFYFVLYLACLALDKLVRTDLFTDIGLLLTFIYLLLGLKNAYGQGWGKSFVKAAILSAVYGLTIALVFGGFLLVAGTIIM